jgi:hypothetical protein
MLVGAPGEHSTPRNSTALDRTGTPSTPARDIAPARSDLEECIMMTAHRRVAESAHRPMRPRVGIRPPPNVALQLTGDGCAEGGVAARLAPHVYELHLAGGHVARS